MENYVGRLCPFCGREIKAGDSIIVCPSCGTALHEGCWTANHGCTTAGCPHAPQVKTPEKVFCEKCGAELAEGQKFCENCGTPRGEKKKRFCENCGAELAEGQIFCSACGTRVDAPAAPAPAPDPAPAPAPDPAPAPVPDPAPAPAEPGETSVLTEKSPLPSFDPGATVVLPDAPAPVSAPSQPTSLYSAPPKAPAPPTSLYSAPPTAAPMPPYGAPAPAPAKKNKILIPILAAAGGTLLIAVLIVCLLVLPKRAKTISLDASSVTVVMGDSYTLGYEIRPEKAKNVSVTWTSYNPEVASVENGVILGKTPGVCTVEAKTRNGKKSLCEVTVKKPDVSSVSLSESSLTMECGEEYTLSYTILPELAADEALTWTSDDPDVASVAGGVITANAPGSCSITASARNGVSGSCSITVLNPAAASISLSRSSVTLDVGDSSAINYTIEPAGAAETGVTWSSSDSSVAEVSNGVIYAYAAGSCTITVRTENGLTSSCSVTVNMSEPDTVVIGTWTAVELLDLDSQEVMNLNGYNWSFVVNSDHSARFYTGDEASSYWDWWFVEIDGDGDYKYEVADGSIFYYIVESDVIWLYADNFCVTCVR